MAAKAARLSKVDLTTDMVREFTELQGKMGGIYAREEGFPVEVWKAIYYQYLPVAVEAEAPPSRDDLGPAALTWAAVALADKLDTIAGLFAAGERPTGSRDPYGLRRAAQGVVKILVDLPALGVQPPQPVALAVLVEAALQQHQASLDPGLREFLWERAAHLFERRGARPDEIRVVGALERSWSTLVETRQRISAVSKARSSERFQALAALFKRVKNITRGIDDGQAELVDIKAALKEPAELALVDAMIARWPPLEKALQAGKYGEAVQTLADLQPFVDQFFKDVLVMADDASLKAARLALLARLRSAVLTRIGDISELAAE